MMQLNMRTIGLLAPLVLSAATLCLAQQRAAPVTGTWTFNILSEQGSGTPTLTFVQQGETLTGKYSGTLFADATLKGTLKGRSITFTVYATFSGARQDSLFTGEYDGDSAMKGTYTNDFGAGTFTAVRKKESAKR